MKNIFIKKIFEKEPPFQTDNFTGEIAICETNPKEKIFSIWRNSYREYYEKGEIKMSEKNKSFRDGE